jgi:hypothetical protein
MSKKLYSSARWKAYLKARQKAQERNAKRRTKFRHKIGELRKITPAVQRKFFPLVVPKRFSVVQHPEEAIAFLSNLNLYAQKHNLTLDLSRVTTLTSDAIAVLVATLNSLRETYVRGNLPDDPDAQRILVGSGFFNHLHSMQPLPSTSQGQISRKRSQKVQPDLARDLIHFGTKSLSGAEQKCNAAYRVLIESMLNTHNHAAKYMGKRETWWATVYADAIKKRVCFTFVDTGVGIFKSVRLGKLRGLYRRLRVISDADILREILQGEVESSTGLSYRGKGLPAIYQLSQLGKIKSLVIVANDVYANISKEEYKLIPVAFRGTLLYWEVEI